MHSSCISLKVASFKDAQWSQGSNKIRPFYSAQMIIIRKETE